ACSEARAPSSSGVRAPSCSEAEGARALPAAANRSPAASTSRRTAISCSASSAVICPSCTICLILSTSFNAFSRQSSRSARDRVTRCRFTVEAGGEPPQPCGDGACQRGTARLAGLGQRPAFILQLTDLLAAHPHQVLVRHGQP